MATAPSDLAKSELVHFLRGIFKRGELETFVRIFYPDVHRDIEWRLNADVYIGVVEACARRGFLDETFFIGIYLCRQACSPALFGLVRHFGIDPEALRPLSTLVPSLRKHRGLTLLMVGSVSCVAGLGLGLFVAPLGGPTVPNVESDPSYGQRDELLPLIQAELAECNEQYGQESDYCTQLAETMKSIDLSTCRVPQSSKRPSSKKTLKVEVALANYLDKKQAEQRMLRRDLQDCRSNLAKIQLMLPIQQNESLVNSKCPPTTLECPPKPNGWSHEAEWDGHKIVGCKLVESKPKPRPDDDEPLMSIPSKKR